MKQRDHHYKKPLKHLPVWLVLTGHIHRSRYHSSVIVYWWLSFESVFEGSMYFSSFPSYFQRVRQKCCLGQTAGQIGDCLLSGQWKRCMVHASAVKEMHSTCQCSERDRWYMALKETPGEGANTYCYEPHQHYPNTNQCNTDVECGTLKTQERPFCLFLCNMQKDNVDNPRLANITSALHLPFSEFGYYFNLWRHLIIVSLIKYF